MKRFIALFCMILIIISPVSYGISIDSNTNEESPAEDIVLNIVDYEPKVVRSANVESTNYNVFALLSGIQSNPTIDIPRVKDVRVNVAEGNKYVSGVSYVKPKKGEITLDNMGYLQIRLKKLKEAEVPSEIIVDMHAKVYFDVTRGFGVNEEQKVLTEMSEDDWMDKKTGFWANRAYIRAESLDWNKGTFVVYDSNFQKTKIELQIGGSPSGVKSLRSVFGEQNIPFKDKYQLRLDSISGPREKANLDLVIDGMYRSVTLSEDEALYPGSDWSVDRIIIGKDSESVRLNNQKTGSSSTLTKTQLVDAGCRIFDGNEEACKETGYCEYKKETCIPIREETKKEEPSVESPSVWQSVWDQIKLSATTSTDYSDWESIKPHFDAYMDYIQKYQNVREAGSGVAEAQKKVGEINKYYFEQGNIEAAKYTADRINSVVMNQQVSVEATKVPETTEDYFGASIAAYDQVVKNYPDSENGMLAAKAQLEIAKIYDLYLNKNEDAIKAYTYLLNVFGEVPYVQGQSDAIRVRISMLRSLDQFTSIPKTIYEGEEKIDPIIVRLVGIDKVEEKDKASVTLIANGIPLEKKQGEIIENEWTISNVDRDTVWFKDSKGRGNAVNLKQSATLTTSDGKSLSIEITDIKTNKEAHITILPGAATVTSESDFRIHIPVEKRPFSLSPAQIDKQIRSTEDMIKELDSIIKKVEVLQQTWTKLCFMIFGFVFLKNFSSGFSGRNTARTQVVDHWKSYCSQDGIKDQYNSIQDCIQKNSEIIGKEIDQAHDAVKDTQGIMTDGTWKSKYPEYKDLPESDARDVILKKKLAEASWQQQSIKESFQKEFIRQDYWDRYVEKQDLFFEEFRKTPDAEKFRSIKETSPDAWDTYTKATTSEQKQSAIDAMVANERARLLREQKTDAFWDKVFNTEYSTFDPAVVDEALKDAVPMAVQSSVEGVKIIDPLYITQDPIDGSYYYSGTGGMGIQFLDSNKDPLKERPVNGEKYTLISNGQTIIVQPQVVQKKEVKHVEILTLVTLGRQTGKLGRISIDPYDYLDIHRFDNGNIQQIDVFKRIEPNSALGKATDVPQFSIGGGNEEYSSSVCKQRLKEHNMDSSICDKIGSVEKKLREQKYEKGDKIGVSDYVIANSIQEGSSLGCFDVMDPNDCLLLFGACDPVMCPPSRFNMDGKWQVNNVVQTGLIGSLVLGPWKEKSVYEPLPICVTGVLAGLKNFRSILQGYQECLVTKKEKGENIGICDKIRSIGGCEILWKESLAFLNLEHGVIGAIAQKTLSNSEGGEYSFFSENMKKTADFTKFFTQEYATTFFAAYRGSSTEEIGKNLCARAIYGKIPGQGSFIDQLLKPESPPQFIAVLNEVPHSEITGEYLSDYDVWYHIYAGEDKDIRYKIYMKDDNQERRALTDNKILEKSGFDDQTVRKFNEKIGFNQVCIVIDGQGERCGFGKTSSGYSTQYLDQKVIESELGRVASTEKECLGETGFVSGGLIIENDKYSTSQVGVNLGSGALNVLSTGLLQTGVVRKCSAELPDAGEGKNKENSAWIERGTCGKDAIGRDLGKCWLRKDGVELLRDKEKQNQQWLQDLGAALLDETEIAKLESDIVVLLEKANQLMESKKYDDAKIKLLEVIAKEENRLKGTLDLNKRADAQFVIGEVYQIIARFSLEVSALEEDTSEKTEAIPEEALNCELEYVHDKIFGEDTLIFVYPFGEWMWKENGIYRKLSDSTILEKSEVFQEIASSLEGKDITQGVAIIIGYKRKNSNDFINVIKDKKTEKFSSPLISSENILNYCQFKALPSLGERIPTPEEGNDELRSALEEVPWEIEYEESAFAVTNMILSYQDQQWLFRFKQGGGPFGIGQGPRGYEEYSPIDQDALLVTKTMDIYNSLLSELQKKNFEDGLTIIVKYANQDKDDYLILHQGIEAQNLEEKPILVQQVVEFFGYGVEPRYKDVLESPIPEVGAPINVDRIISRIQKYDKDIELYSTQKGLDSLFVRAIISRESQGISSIGSSAGAIGLMQVMPGTAKGECNAKGDIRTWLKDPKRNIVCGTTVYANYYKQVEKFVKTKGGDTSDQENLMKLTLAAYNGGPARVECLINQYGEKWEDIAKKASGRFGKECKNSAIRGYVRLPSETKNYVGFVLGYYYYYKQNDIF